MLKVYEQSNGGRKAALIYQKQHSCGTASIISNIEDENNILAIDKRSDLFDVLKVYEQSNKSLLLSIAKMLFSSSMLNPSDTS